jgi:hypothetical protein
METAGDDHDGIGLLEINQPVFQIDAPGPVAGKIAFEWFGLANTDERCALNIFDEVIDLS